MYVDHIPISTLVRSRVVDRAPHLDHTREAVRRLLPGAHADTDKHRVYAIAL